MEARKTRVKAATDAVKVGEALRITVRSLLRLLLSFMHALSIVSRVLRYFSALLFWCIRLRRRSRPISTRSLNPSRLQSPPIFPSFKPQSCSSMPLSGLSSLVDLPPLQPTSSGLTSGAPEGITRRASGGMREPSAKWGRDGGSVPEEGEQT
jgi:hypothetical protein